MSAPLVDAASFFIRGVAIRMTHHPSLSSTCQRQQARHHSRPMLREGAVGGEQSASFRPHVAADVVNSSVNAVASYPAAVVSFGSNSFRVDAATRVDELIARVLYEDVLHVVREGEAAFVRCRGGELRLRCTDTVDATALEAVLRACCSHCDAAAVSEPRRSAPSAQSSPTPLLDSLRQRARTHGFPLLPMGDVEAPAAATVGWSPLPLIQVASPAAPIAEVEKRLFDGLQGEAASPPSGAPPKLTKAATAAKLRAPPPSGSGSNEKQAATSQPVASTDHEASAGPSAPTATTMPPAAGDEAKVLHRAATFAPGVVKLPPKLPAGAKSARSSNPPPTGPPRLPSKRPAKAPVALAA